MTGKEAGIMNTGKGIIIFIVITGKSRIQPFLQIPVVFIIQRHAVIFRMALDKNLPAIPAHNQEYAGLIGLCQDHQFRMLPYVFSADLRIPGVRR